MKPLKIFLVIVIVAVIGIASAFLVVNWDNIMPNSNVEQIQPDSPGYNDSEKPGNDNESEKPGNSTDKPSEEPDDPTDDTEPIQPGEEIEITISRDKITF